MRQKMIIAMLLACSANAYGDVFLGRDVCQFDFSSIMKHSGQTRRSVECSEKKHLLEMVKNDSDLACLESRVVHSCADNKKYRQKPYTENCSVLPSRYYSDASGKVIYRISSTQMRRIETMMLTDQDLNTCMSPLLEF